MTKSIFNNKALPLKRKIKVLYMFSFVIVLMVAVVSVLGLLYQDIVYPSANLLYSFVPNDIVNIFIGLPFLFISLWFVWKGKIIGLIYWSGAIFYFIYVYFPYIICVPFNFLFLPYLVLFSLSIYMLIGILTSIDYAAVKDYVSDEFHAKISGNILIGFGALIIVRQIILIVNALINKTIVEPQEIALWIDDFSLGSPALLISGFNLRKKTSFGYISGIGLLIVYGILSLGLIPFLFIQSYLKNTSIDIIAVIILIVMALICLIPVALFIRKVNNKTSTQ